MNNTKDRPRDLNDLGLFLQSGMQFFRGKNKKDSSNNNSKEEDKEGGGNHQQHLNDHTNTNSNSNNIMQESDIINELDQLASEPSANAEFSDDPQQDTPANDGSSGVKSHLAAVGGASGGASAGASGGGTTGGGGVESLKMLDSDDGADMDIFDDDDGDEYAGGGGAGRKESSSFSDDKSPISWSGTGKKKVVSAALRDEIKQLLNTPLTIPALNPKNKGRDRDRDRGDSDDDDDDDDHDDKSSESGEDYTDDEDEGESGYKAGGYHPVKVGDIFNQGYVFLALSYLVLSC